MRTREYQVTPRTFFQYSRQRGLYEAFYRDDDRVRHEINEYCETEDDAIKACVAWQLRNEPPEADPPF